MFGELMSAISSVKTIRDMLGTALDAKTFNIVNAVLIEMNSKMIAAQELTSRLQAEKAFLADEVVTYRQKIRDLEQEVARLVEWKEERAHYRLAEVATGAFAYVLQPVGHDSQHTARPTHPAHWLCCQCYDMGNKSILQFSKWQSHTYREFICQRCKSTLTVNTPSDGPMVMTTGSSRRGFGDAY